MTPLRMLRHWPPTSEKISNPLLKVSQYATKDILLCFLHHWNRQENYKSFTASRFEATLSLVVRLVGAEVMCFLCIWIPLHEKVGWDWFWKQYCTTRCKHKPFQIALIIYTCHFYSTFSRCPRKSATLLLAKYLPIPVRGPVPSRNMWRAFSALALKRPQSI